jgi:hypothetical protein
VPTLRASAHATKPMPLTLALTKKRSSPVSPSRVGRPRRRSVQWSEVVGRVGDTSNLARMPAGAASADVVRGPLADLVAIVGGDSVSRSTQSREHRQSAVALVGGVSNNEGRLVRHLFVSEHPKSSVSARRLARFGGRGSTRRSSGPANFPCNCLGRARLAWIRAEEEGFEPSSDPDAQNGFRDRRKGAAAGSIVPPTAIQRVWDRKSPGVTETRCDEMQPAAGIGSETRPSRRFVLAHVVSFEETPANRMGRARFELATLGLKVRPNERLGTAAS